MSSQTDDKLLTDGHDYRIVAWWTSGRTGIARTDSAPNVLHFTAPVQFGGLEGRWTPEDLLLAAVASCYTTTFRALADYSKCEYADLGVEVDATMEKVDSGYRFTEIVTRPNLTLDTVEGKDRATRLLQKTQALCLVTRALSVSHRFKPCIRVTKAAPHQ